MPFTMTIGACRGNVKKILWEIEEDEKRVAKGMGSIVSLFVI